MPDSFTEYSSQSWFSRIAEAFKAVIVGLVLFVVSFPLLWWNEGRAVRTAKGLVEAAGAVVPISPDKIDPAQDNKLVYATGTATTTETLTDPQFGISEKVIKLRRAVAMFQWTEKESKETVKKLGGGTETKTTYTYEQQWSEKSINSKDFKVPDKHTNLDMRFSSRTTTAKLVTLGAMKLSAGLTEQMNDFQLIALDAKTADKLPDACKKQAVFRENHLYLPAAPDAPAADPASPAIGDVKISFEVVRPADVSILARQVGDTLSSWQSSTGSTVERLMPGTVSAQSMIGTMEAENTNLTWILRGVGFVLMAVGIGLIVNPLAVLADVLPFLGSFLRFGAGLFAFFIAAALSLLTIAFAWLAYRPAIGVGLLAAAIGLIVLLRVITRRKQPATA